MPISRDYLEGLGKQVFITDYLLNGLFPCQSNVVRLIRSKKKEWKFTDKYEYRMLLANTNTGGSLNSQVLRSNLRMRKPGELEYGTYHATYGMVVDGFDIDMTKNLETKEKTASFETDYATLIHSCRSNVAALFKNFAIHGRYGVVHQIRTSIEAPVLSSDMNPQPNVFTPILGTPFTIQTPINVFNSNFKRGKMLIKTKAAAPWGTADVTELYLVLDNQPRTLSLLPIGTTVSPWRDGEFLEVAQNREIIGTPLDTFSSWVPGGVTVATGAFAGEYDQFTGTGVYTNGDSAVTGAMEGLADIFPWYTDPANPNTRLGLDMFFRGQPNRLRYSTEQAGGFYLQKEGEHIIDAIMAGLWTTKSAAPYGECAIFMNPATKLALGYEEGTNVLPIRDNLVSGPIVYQRGVKTITYQIGNSVIEDVVEDMNLPTDVILIGPKQGLFYNCFDNATMEIDKYIQETWSKSEPPKIENLVVPNELITKMDISQRIMIGSPETTDGRLTSLGSNGGFRHPSNTTPIVMQELGSIYSEHTYAYTVVKLREPIIDLYTV